MAVLCFVASVNLMTLWYLLGIFLFGTGLLAFCADGDIFVGFLWIIDLGVGLIFLIFILHFTNFLHQRSYSDISARKFLVIVLAVLFGYLFQSYALESSPNNYVFLKKTWFFLITWYNYFYCFNIYPITELSLMQTAYFQEGSFGFFVINWSLLYGLYAVVSLCFLVRRIFLFLNLSQVSGGSVLEEANSASFIRTQNFLRQQNTSAGSRVWTKKRAGLR